MSARTGCDGRDAGQASESAALRSFFERFWPKGMPFPPLAPYLGAARTRVEAWAWLVSLAPHHEGLATGDLSEVFDFIGRSLSGDGVYGQERKRKKCCTPREPPETPSACPATFVLWNEICGFWQTVTVECNGTVTYDPPCEGSIESDPMMTSGAM